MTAVQPLLPIVSSFAHDGGSVAVVVNLGGPEVVVGAVAGTAATAGSGVESCAAEVHAATATQAAADTDRFAQPRFANAIVRHSGRTWPRDLVSQCFCQPVVWGDAVSRRWALGPSFVELSFEPLESNRITFTRMMMK